MSVRHGQSIFRDRTDEFSGIVERLRKSIAPAANGSNRNDGARREDPRSAAIIKSELSRASKICLGIHQTSQKVSKLGKLVMRTSVFDDPTQETQELMMVIKQEISALTTAFCDLKVLRNSQNDEGNISSDTAKHAKLVVDSLENRLKDTAKEFKDVLTMRTENIKIHENRRQLFSSNASKKSANPFVRQRPLAAASESASLPWANGSSSSSSQLVLRKQGEAESLPLLQQRQHEQQQQQQMVPLQDTYMQSRAEALHYIQSTTHELNNMFIGLATMISQQGEIAIRIDQNMEDTLANVEGAQSQLARYLYSISSNRWLMMKIFFVLIAFLMIFLFFVA